MTSKAKRPITATFRARHGLSQLQLATALPVSLRTLQEWECGRSTPPGYLARALADVARELDKKPKR